MLRVLRIILGTALIIIGLLALVTPLTPGAWLALLGLELVGLSFLLPRRIRDPWERMKADMREKMRKWCREK
jgi:uncharacterized protein YqgC (DUF456 family)